MQNKRNKRRKKKTDFGTIRYPSSAMLPFDKKISDKEFWTVYYGVSDAGVMSQLQLEPRWHAIQCIEGGFEKDPQGLKENRRALIGLLYLAADFEHIHATVAQSTDFQKRKEILDNTPGVVLNPDCQWETRAIRALLEYGWYQQFEHIQFHEKISSPSMCISDKWVWLSLTLGLAHEKTFDLKRDWMQNDWNIANKRVSEKVENEWKAAIQIEENNPTRALDCIQALIRYIKKRRDAYSQTYPQVAEQDKEIGHTNFGMPINICDLDETLQWVTEMRKNTK